MRTSTSPKVFSPEIGQYGRLQVRATTQGGAVAAGDP
jgi:hypothetical protein